MSMESLLTRRTLLAGALALPLLRRHQSASAQGHGAGWFTAPIGWPGQAPGDGFRIGHGFACENTWFAAGWWHTGEDWYAAESETGGARVLAVAAGEVAYADFNYPGRVVIIRHADDLYSMYGHLDPALLVEVGQQVAAGDHLGNVLMQPDIRGPGQAPSHLHFEIRTFLTRGEVNGDAPQYGVNCGFQCPPGPGYWPIAAAGHPATMGWRNPTQARLAQVTAPVPDDLLIVANSARSPGAVPVFAAPDETLAPLQDITMEPGTGMQLSEISVGDPAATGTSAEAYDAWLRVRLDDGLEGWVQAAIPSDRETGTDGRPSSLDVPWLI
jgi:murein DD-endopeptidase MepM/ murein hydrolase activator NlpD